MSDDQEHFAEFMKTREAAAKAYVRGDAAPLGEIVAQDSPATFFGPQGGHVVGAKEVRARYAGDAESFEGSGTSHFEILHQGASEGIGYWVGFQHAQAKMRGHGELIPMKLRVTEVFRREGNAWRLIHRHADSLASETKKQ